MRYPKKNFSEKNEFIESRVKTTLELFFEKKTMEEISEKVGYTVEYATRKKYKAKIKLVQLIKEDKTFKYFDT